MKKFLLMTPCLYLFMVCLCTGSRIAGTETTNGDELKVTAAADSIKGVGPSGAEVRIFAANYFPYNDSGFADTVTADQSGAFEFPGLTPGIYNVYSTSITNDLSVFISSIAIATSDNGLPDTVEATFDTTGSIAGELVDTLKMPIENAYVFLQGSPFWTMTDNNGAYRLLKVPGGKYALTFIANNRNANWSTGPLTVSAKIIAGRETAMGQVTFE